MYEILSNVPYPNQNSGATPVHLISIHILVSTVICTLSQKKKTLSLFQNLRKITVINQEHLLLIPFTTGSTELQTLYLYYCTHFIKFMLSILVLVSAIFMKKLFGILFNLSSKVITELFLHMVKEAQVCRYILNYFFI